MKTVGEFLSAGLNFVKGDCVSDYLGGEETFLDEFDKNDCNEQLGFSLSFVTKFAWRENTGVKPEFKGLIDVVTANKCEYQRLSPDSAALEFEDDRFDCYVIKWRPSLNQPQQWPDNSRMDIIGQNVNDGLHYDNTAQQVETLAVNDKPIFTQAMACAGEFPLIGAKCVYVFMENGSEYTGSIAAIDGNVIWFNLDGGGYKTCFGVHKFKAVDNRTDREKAIDEMLELDLWATDREFLEAIYDAGYRKC